MWAANPQHDGALTFSPPTVSPSDNLTLEFFDPLFFWSLYHLVHELIFRPCLGAGGLIVTFDIQSIPLTWIVTVSPPLLYSKSGYNCHKSPGGM